MSLHTRCYSWIILTYRCRLSHQVSWAVDKRLLFIPVEFARDVSQQSLNTRTTQEQVGKCIRSGYESAVCFVFTGFHDQAIPRKYIDPATWKRNMNTFVKDELLEGGGCRVVVGLTLTAVLGIKRFDQTNERGGAFNELLMKLEAEGFEEGWGSQGR